MKKMENLIIRSLILFLGYLIIDGCKSEKANLREQRNLLEKKVQNEINYGIQQYFKKKVFIIDFDSIMNFNWDFVFVDNMETRLDVGNKQFYYKNSKYSWKIKKIEKGYNGSDITRFLFIRNDSVVQYIELSEIFIRKMHFVEDTSLCYNSFSKETAKFIVCCANINADTTNCSVHFHPISGCSNPACFCQEFYIKHKK